MAQPLPQRNTTDFKCFSSQDFNCSGVLDSILPIWFYIIRIQLLANKFRPFSRLELSSSWTQSSPIDKSCDTFFKTPSDSVLRRSWASSPSSFAPPKARSQHWHWLFNVLSHRWTCQYLRFHTHSWDVSQEGPQSSLHFNQMCLLPSCTHCVNSDKGWLWFQTMFW